MDMLNVCAGHGELVLVVCGVCHLILIVSSYLYCVLLPLCNELMKRLLTFAQKCIHCGDNRLGFVARYAVWYDRMASPLHCSVFHCCYRHDFEYENFMSMSHQYIQGYYWSMVSREDVDKARALLELIYAFVFKIWGVSF